MLYRLAIFDFDGTLADSFPWFMGAVNRAADRYGFRRLEAEDAQRLRGEDARAVIRHLRMPMWKMPLVTAFMRREMARDIGGIRLFPGVPEMLEGLARAGVGLAVVTSNSEANVRRALGTRLAGLVAHYGCGASIFGKRPKLRRVLADARVRPSDALCIGDELRDLHAASGEGIPFGAVAWGFTRVETLAAHAPAEVFTRVDEIVERVAG